VADEHSKITQRNVNVADDWGWLKIAGELAIKILDGISAFIDFLSLLSEAVECSLVSSETVL
jgi:hypothetical protein